MGGMFVLSYLAILFVGGWIVNRLTGGLIMAISKAIIQTWRS